MKGLKLSLF